MDGTGSGSSSIFAVLFGRTLFVSEELRAFSRDGGRRDTLVHRAFVGLFSARSLITTTRVLGLLIAVLIGPSLWTRITMGQVLGHWSRVVLTGLLTFSLCPLYPTRLVAALIRLHVARHRHQQQAAQAAALRAVNERVNSRLTSPTPQHSGRPGKPLSPAQVVLT